MTDTRRELAGAVRPSPARKKPARRRATTPKTAKSKTAKPKTTKPKTTKPNRGAKSGKPRPAAQAPGLSPPPEPADTKPVGVQLFELLSPEQRATLDQLSVNLARAAMTAQGAIAEAALRQADRPAGLTPDPFHVAPALSEVMARLAAQPDRLMRAQADLFNRYLDLWKAAAARAQGEDAKAVVEPTRTDRRFADASWTESPVFDVVKQSYLITSDCGTPWSASRPRRRS